MIKGSCLCGAVAFEFDSAGVVASVKCYCTNCRKISGSQFGVYLQVKKSSFRWLAGEDLTMSYESSPGNDRAFCCTCGSVAPIVTAYGAVRIPAGALDEDPGVTPSVVIFDRSRANWCESEAETKSFADAGPREMWGEMIKRLHVAD